MRYPASEKLEIIRTVEESALGIARMLRHLSIPKSTFYHWYDRFLTGGVEALEDRKPPASWNKVPEEQRQALLEMALNQPDLSPRELAVRFTDDRQYFISEATAYRILKAHDLVTFPAWIVLKAADTFEQPTTAINQLWQTDFTYLKVTGWAWHYLSSVMVDYSRYILAWRLCQTMTQGKIERWHRSLKNRILLDHYYLPSELEQEINALVTHYNTRRYHESLNNLTPEDVWLGRGQSVLDHRRKIKETTLQLRIQLYLERKTA